MSLKRIAPNNHYEAECFMEVFYEGDVLTQDKKPYSFKDSTPVCYQSDWVLNVAKAKPVCLFRIRENKLPTIHNFYK